MFYDVKNWDSKYTVFNMVDIGRKLISVERYGVHISDKTLVSILTSMLRIYNIYETNEELLIHYNDVYKVKYIDGKLVMLDSHVNKHKFVMSDIYNIWAKLVSILELCIPSGYLPNVNSDSEFIDEIYKRVNMCLEDSFKTK